MHALKTLAWFVTGLVATIYLIHFWLPSWGLAIVLGVALYFALTLIVGVYELKKLAINSIPENIRMMATQPSFFPELDLRRLEEWTDELHSLGFETLREYSLTSSNGKEVPCFARMFIHPTEHCFAEIGQIFPPGLEAMPLACVIYTHFENEVADEQKPISPRPRPTTTAPPIPAAEKEEDLSQYDDQAWALATTSRALDPVLWALRHPRKLISTHLQESPAGLFAIHRKKREEMARALNLEISSDLTYATFELRVAASNARLERALRRKNPFLFLYEWKLVAPKHHEWWGDYPRLAAKRARKNLS